MILITYETNIEEIDKNGNTALHLAAIYGHSLIVTTIKNIISKSKDINAQNKNGNTPLILAVKYNNTEVINQLNKTANIDTEVTNKKGETVYTIEKNNISNIFYPCNERHGMSKF